MAALLLTVAPASALEKDKKGHLMAGVSIGFMITLGTKKPKYGFYTGCAAGAAKEFADSRGNGTVEFADFAYTCAGAGVASWLTGKIIGQ